MFVISFNICLFIYFSVKYAIQSNDCDVFVNKQSIYLSIYLYIYPCIWSILHQRTKRDEMMGPNIYLPFFTCDTLGNYELHGNRLVLEYTQTIYQP